MIEDPVHRSRSFAPGQPSRGPTRVLGFVALASLGLALEACGPARVATRPLTTPPSTVQSTLRSSTEPTEGSVLIFGWTFSERGSTVEGRGVARLEPPDRVRLDLFTENGETAARAALVGSDLRVPPDVDDRLVPPPPLLWASLGVFHPGADAELLGGEELVDGPSRLRYRTVRGSETRFLYRDARLVGAEFVDGGYVVERVELEWGQWEDFPATAVYRDVRAFRELRVILRSREPEDSFASDIWLPQWR